MSARSLLPYLLSFSCSAALLGLVLALATTLPPRLPLPSRPSSPPPNLHSNPHLPPNPLLRLLSLLPLSPEEIRSPVIAAIIENHEDARAHQEGLREAAVVFEVIVEGDISRFVALYEEGGLSERIGPIRSLRPHMISVLEPYEPLLLHAGGSALAYEMLEQGAKVLSHDGIRHDGETYERERNIPAPHNLYIYQERISGLLEKERSRLPEHTFPLFQTSSTPPDGEAAPLVHLRFGSPVHDVTFTEDPPEERYRRSADGAPVQAEVANLLVLEAKVEGYGQAGTIPWTQTFGGGDLLLFRNGRKVEGRWERVKGGPFRFLSESGEPLPLAPGKVWITLLPSLELVEVEPTTRSAGRDP